jgi:predicted ArsR family transcriptional regulator
MTDPAPNPPQRTSDLDAVSSLADPLRRKLYDFVVSSSGPVSRDEIADHVGVTRQVAAYHLDLLAEKGLLEVEFRRLSGRQGPGAGRPSKLYRRSDREFGLSVPPRQYELAARILLETVRTAHVDADALEQVAHRAGCAIGATGLDEALSGAGYEPATENGEVRFKNCPFHVLRDQDQDTTCKLNLALVEGMIDGAGSDVTAVLAPEEGYCCVRLRSG